MMPWPLITLAGGVIGVGLGFFGVGGSSIATPVLSLLGVPALAAIASPLPATIPAALISARNYVRDGTARRKAAAWSLLGGVPATIIGAPRVRWGAKPLLVMSGLVLVIVGARVVRPIHDEARAAGTARRMNRPRLVAAAAGVGLFTGLLANGVASSSYRCTSSCSGCACGKQWERACS